MADVLAGRALGAFVHAALGLAPPGPTAPMGPRPMVPAVVAEEFLTRAELLGLVGSVLERRDRFVESQVIDPDGVDGRVRPEHRRSRVLFEHALSARVVDRVRAVLPWVWDRLGEPPFAVDAIEAQITASNDGEYFRVHNDNTHAVLTVRRLTFVYFFHREPVAFEGGELCIHGRPDGRDAFETRVVVPTQNAAVFFPSDAFHEIRPVRCPSGRFEDSRFAVNGWVRCAPDR